MALTLTVHGGRSFAQLDPSTGVPGASRYFFRHDWIGEVAIEAQGHGSGAVTWTAANGGGRGDRNRFLVARPPQPGVVRVTCRSGAESRDVEVWFVACTLGVNDSGPPGTGNPQWSQVQAVLRQTYVGGQSYSFPELGLVTFPGSSSENSGRRYGRFVELIGKVSPASCPLRFFHARRIVSAAVTGVDAAGRPLEARRGPRTTVPAAGSNDTSRQQETTLTPAGKVFDYDLPGGLMTAANQVGDRHRWQVTFEQVVAVGAPPAGNQWEAVAAAGRAVSPIVRWTADYTARCTRAADAVNVIPDVAVTAGG